MYKFHGLKILTIMLLNKSHFYICITLLYHDIDKSISSTNVAKVSICSNNMLEIKKGAPRYERKFLMPEYNILTH